jgi:hypothetical protein
LAILFLEYPREPTSNCVNVVVEHRARGSSLSGILPVSGDHWDHIKPLESSEPLDPFGLSESFPACRVAASDPLDMAASVGQGSFSRSG